MEKTLYKFSSPETALKIVSTMQLRYTALSDLNDPLEEEYFADFKLDESQYKELYDLYCNRIRNHRSRGLLYGTLLSPEEWLKDELNFEFKNYMSDVGIISMTERPYSDLTMFCHYAGFNKGVCFTLFFKDFDENLTLKEVNYKEKFDSIDISYESVKKILQNIDEKNDEIIPSELKKELIGSATKKHESWRYENEFRLLNTKHYPGFPEYVSIDDLLTEITFGVESEQYLIDSIRSLVQGKGVELYRLENKSGFLDRKILK